MNYANKIIKFELLFLLSLAANNFNKTIKELDSTQSALVSTLNGNKALLQNVQETFALNLESVNKEVGRVESRLKATEKK